LNLECGLVETMEFPTNYLFVNLNRQQLCFDWLSNEHDGIF
jgi:hypothetical protein